ncbi:MAG: hypothetical protein M3R13_08780 [Armatimonadota bacterium]|nr:hypothetical protein [Armatimonadota bacterium]
MKGKGKGLSRAMSLAGLSLGCCVMYSAVAADGFDTTLPSLAKKLEQSFAIRTADTCAPLAPIETTLRFGSTPRLGVPVDLHFDVRTFEAGRNAEVRFDVPRSVGLDGPSVETGTLEADRGYRFTRTIVFDKFGTYEIAAQAIAGVSEYRFGRRNRLYVVVDERGIRYSERPFDFVEADALSPSPVFGGRGEPRRLFEPRTALQLPGVEIPKVDPEGGSSARPAGGPDAATTVFGYWRYRHTDATLHDGYGTAAEAWDDDGETGDDFLGDVAVGSDGYYEINFDNGEQTGGAGTADVYLTFRTNNSEVQVHNAPNNEYATSTNVIWTNITGGSHNAGTYFADWGTNGISDHNERAFQLLDDLTRGWSTGVGFGHNAHKTFCEWYLGSTDGAYYRRAENRIYINDAHVSSIDVTLHEYGHSYHDSFNGDDDWPPGAGGSHWFTNHYTDGLALTEGYGTYFSCAAQNDDRWYDDLDPGNLIHFDCDANWDGHETANGNSDNLSNNPFWGYDTESAVLAMLLDLDDTRNSPTDPYDWSSLSHQEIHDVFHDYMVSGHHLYSIRDFYAGWYDQAQPERPKMNGQMMVHGMKQGISRGALGVEIGISSYAGTWYFGGYGRASFTAKNYGSQNYLLNQLYVWATDPDGSDIPGFGGDGNNALIASGASREIFKAWDQVGLTGGGVVVGDPAYGLYRFRAGHYRSDGAWQLLEPAEAGTDRDITKNVIQDTTAPTVTSQDDGDFQFSRTSIHLTATAVETQSSIRSFWVRLGSTPGDDDILAFTEYPQNNDPTFNETIVFPQVAYGTTIYASVVARNIEGDDGWSSTDGIEVVNPERMPTVFTPIRGQFISNNNVAAVQTSDNLRMVILPGIVFNPGQDPIVAEFTGSAPLMPLSSIDLKIESSASSTGVRLYMDMYDYDTNEFVEVGSNQSATTDTIYTINRADWNRWVSPSGQLRCRVRYRATGIIFSYPYQARLDWVHWTLHD